MMHKIANVFLVRNESRNFFIFFPEASGRLQKTQKENLVIMQIHFYQITLNDAINFDLSLLIFDSVCFLASKHKTYFT